MMELGKFSRLIPLSNVTQMQNFSPINRFSVQQSLLCKYLVFSRASDVCDASGFLRLFFCRAASDCSMWILSALEPEQVSTWGPKPVKNHHRISTTVSYPTRFFEE
ncbi:uncharacterized protein LOC114355101 [Ostrinia furnacalis]|uniref:uncharacterized protein LOC114355101 n=1 Tax=Ostrinia furnacalis TaxID=93504 RepID=UPI00103CC827|nr:uncharacterized protein LOC114355101 [Ostrinia furnacalis]